MALSTKTCGYKKTWHNVHIEERITESQNKSDYHFHDYYEITVILSGNVTVLVSDRLSDGVFARAVLTPPNAPHHLNPNSDAPYRRINVGFSEEFIAPQNEKEEEILSVFGKSGTEIYLSTTRAEELAEILHKAEKEQNLFRKRLLIFYLISLLSDLKKSPNDTIKLPQFISGAIDYINIHYAEKINAENLAWHLNIGRTTLLTSFKKYVGLTMNAYLIKCRMHHAVMLLKQGKSEPEVAEAVGFGDSANMIRTFKRELGTTPMKYIKLK
jgi:AraC-like DNA-binding protein/quercetin dioxygenase-like cupin family protein